MVHKMSGLIPKEVWKVKGFIFSYQPLNIQVDQIFCLFLVKPKFIEIEYTVDRMAFIAGNADFFFFNILPVNVGMVFEVLDRG